MHMVKGFQATTDIFANEDSLQENYTPEKLPEREDELNDIHMALAPAARGSEPHNMFIYGKSGLGKTAAVKSKLDALRDSFQEMDELDGDELTVIEYNCAEDTSSYKVMQGLIHQLTGETLKGRTFREISDRFFEELSEIGGTVILMLDEIDSIGTDDKILYSIPRAQNNDRIPDEMKLSVIGVSNDHSFHDNLSPKVLDSLGEKEVQFNPYDANQLNSILTRRAGLGFKDGVLSEDVIPLCAAHAAQDHGSARQAIKYLYTAGEIASRDGDDKVTKDHVDEAEESIERNLIEASIQGMTVQDQTMLAAVLSVEVDSDSPSRTREIYAEYKEICKDIDLDPNQMRSLRTHLFDLEKMGIISSTERTTGSRGGKHYVFDLDADVEMTVGALESVGRLSETISLITTNKSITDYTE